VILVDANLLIYASTPAAPQHAAARSWLDARLSGTAAVGVPWPSLLAFVRIKSNPRSTEFPTTVADAWRQVEAWLDAPPVWVPTPTELHPGILGRLLVGQPLSSNLVPDAHLAALAMEHGLTLCSTDGDFARFPGLRWENPL
jgi:toxin-antitoxin system PIN domain toxin